MRTQKRTRRITLVILATTAALTVAACDAKPTSETDGDTDATIYGSVEQCVGVNARDDCGIAYSDALDQHLRTAPSYDDLSRCEAVHGAGKCGSVERGSRYIPMMQGFIVGAVAGAAVGSMRPTGAPVYTRKPNCDARNDPRNCSGESGTGSHFYSGSTFVGSAPSSRPVSVAPATVTVARGGFGAIGLGASAAS